MNDIRQMIQELGKLGLVLLPYIVLGFMAYQIAPDLALLPVLPLFAGISINGMLPKRYRLPVFVLVSSGLALLAGLVWAWQAGAVVAASGAVRLVVAAMK